MALYLRVAQLFSFYSFYSPLLSHFIISTNQLHHSPALSIRCRLKPSHLSIVRLINFKRTWVGDPEKTYCNTVPCKQFSSSFKPQIPISFPNFVNSKLIYVMAAAALQLTWNKHRRLNSRCLVSRVKHHKPL